MGIFNKRTAFKPFVYKEVEGFKDAIHKSPWTHRHWNFVSDIQDFKTQLTPIEKEAVKRCLLAISQIEVSVKRFWVKIGDRFPVAEIDQVGVTFGDSEVRHADAYSHLLEVLGLNAEFDKVLDVPAIKGRVNYLTKYIRGADQMSNREYTLSLALFSIFIENVSLFSQFLIMKSINKSRKILKDIDNVISATAREEFLHHQFGVYLIKKIFEEHPTWNDQDFHDELRKACLKSFKHETEIIDWIFEEGEMDHLPKSDVIEFVKNRFNESMIAVGSNPVFDVDQSVVSGLMWFDEETLGELVVDFFNKRPISYSSGVQSITEDDLF